MEKSHSSVAMQTEGVAIVERVNSIDAHGDAKGRMGRFHDEEAYLGPPIDSEEEDITTGQKMLSAVSGSLFTSLIGMFCCQSQPFKVSEADIWHQSLHWMLYEYVYSHNRSQQQ